MTNNLYLDYYSDPSELLMENGESTKGIIEHRILPDIYMKDRRLETILTEIIKHPDMIEVLETFCVTQILDSKELWDYVNEYTVDELGDMDGVWNILGDVLDRSIREYFKE